jgi:two-component system, repressor protein LuxO
LVIEETLRLHNGSVSQASRVLDISPSTLYRKLERWNRGQ